MSMLIYNLNEINDIRDNGHRSRYTKRGQQIMNELKEKVKNTRELSKLDIPFTLTPSVEAYGVFLDNQFHHFVATADGGSGIIKLYGDGVLLATHGGLVIDPTTSGRAVVFGKDGTSGGNYGKGSLTNIKVFNRVISAEETLI